MTTQISIKEMSDKTEGGYSYFSYSDSGWKGAIRVLRNKGLDDEQIEVFMLSKHTRWAGDSDNKRKCGGYNGATIKEYLSKVTPKGLTQLMDDLMRYN